MWKQEPWSPIMAPGKNQLKSKKEDNFPGRRRNNTVQQKKDESCKSERRQKQAKFWR